MLTQCPECQTTFRVTHAILRGAGGQVRCGRCRTQFDALVRLLDDEGLPVNNTEASTPAGDTNLASPTINEKFVVEVPPNQEDITLEGKRIEITGTYRMPDVSDGDDPPREVVREVHVVKDADPEADQSASDGRELDTAQFLARRVAAEERLLREAESKLDTSDAEADEVNIAAVSGDVPPPPPAPAPPTSIDELELLSAPKRRKPTPLLWKIVLAPIALLIVLQIVHHERAQLARHPRIGPPLQRLYASLGIPIDPAWDLSAYDLQQSGVMTDPGMPGALTVRASIMNRAAYPQPYPLFKIVLEDRWGTAIRAREFRPDEYAPNKGAPGLLAPNQKTDVRIAIADPGPDAEGFRFDLCLQRSRGTVCAEETPTK